MKELGTEIGTLKLFLIFTIVNYQPSFLQGSANGEAEVI